MSLFQKLAPAVRRVAQSTARAAPKRSMSTESTIARPTEADYQDAREGLLGLAGAAVFMTYAAVFIAGEPAHEAAHPFYNAPFPFAKQDRDLGAGWWPGRHCQFFEFNCFAKAYKEADELLAAQNN